jgi:hypothetical protein
MPMNLPRSRQKLAMPGQMKRRLPAIWTTPISKQFATTCFRMFTIGPEKPAPCAFRKTAVCSVIRNIESEATKLFAKLKTAKFLQGLSSKDFAKQVAHFLAELNAIHAFREGNGRAQLSFFLLLADQAGHPLDFDDFDPDAFLEAMIVSFGGDEAPLVSFIENLVAE